MRSLGSIRQPWGQRILSVFTFLTMIFLSFYRICSKLLFFVFLLFFNPSWIWTPDIWKIYHVQTIKDLHKNFFHNLRCKKSEVKLLRLSHFPVKFNARIWSNSQAKIGVQVPKSQRGQNSTENQIFHYEDLLIKMKSLL